MPTEVILPKVDMDMTHGTIGAWHVVEGETVEKGAPLFDIETDKAAMEVEAPASGTLQQIAAQAGSEVAIGTTVAWIFAEGEEVSVMTRTGDATSETEGGGDPANAPVTEAAPQAKSASDADTADVAQDNPNRLRATPKARHAARQAGLDLAPIAGSGPRGRIQARDIPANRERDTAEWTPQPGPLHVSSLGRGGGTPIVFLHGFAGDNQTWAPLLEALAQGHPSHRIALPCHGRSPRRKVGGFTALSAMIRDAFDALNLELAHVVGHSLGGALALALADTRPRKVASLTLIAPAGLGPEVNGAALDGIARAGRAESLAPWLRCLVADKSMITDEFARVAFAQRADAAQRAAQRDMAASLFPDATQAMDLTGALDRVRCPARIVWGRQDEIVPWRHALRAPGNVALHLFERTGHVPHLERPGEIATLLAGGL